MALGGGTFCQSENLSFVKSRGLSIWLNCPLDEILRRLPNDGSRPLFRSPAEVEALLAYRTQSYEQADFKIMTAQRRVDEIVGEILEWLKTRGPIKVHFA